MPQPGSLSASRNRQELVRERKLGIMLDVHFCCSACFSWSSMEEKKRHSAPAEAIAPLSAWRSPKETISATEYCSRSRSVAHCALSSSIFAERRSDAKRAIPACFLESSFDIYTPRFFEIVAAGASCRVPLRRWGEGFHEVWRHRQDSLRNQLTRQHHILYIVS